MRESVRPVDSNTERFTSAFGERFVALIWQTGRCLFAPNFLTLDSHLMSKNLRRFNFWRHPIMFLVMLSAAVSVAEAFPPVLLSRANSTRAVALESLTRQREPFALTSSSLLQNGQPDRTRILLFAVNLPTTDASSVTADAEDGTHRHYNLTVEFVGPLPGGEGAGISQLIVRLSDDLTVVGDVLVRVTYQGVASNRVRVGIGYIGDGLPDDTITISGRVTTNATTGLANTFVTLSGSATASTATDNSGNYSFTNLVPGGTYNVTASRVNYTLSPQSQNFPFLVLDQAANFSATPLNYTLSGRITDNNDPLAAITVTLSGSQPATTTTDANGNYTFTVPAEGNYMVTPTSLLYAFSPSSFALNNLSGSQTLNFVTARRLTYSISGFVKTSNGNGLGGVTVRLDGSQTAAVNTDSTGFYAFANLNAGGNYTLTAARQNYTITPQTKSFTQLSANQTSDFAATPALFTISGQVLDGTTPMSGVLMSLTGSQSLTTVTNSNGNYFFSVPAEGNYTVLPLAQFSNFTPVVFTVDNLNNDQIFNFKTTNLFSVLEFDGSPQTVDYGRFFLLQPGQTQLGHFYWEFWAMPGTNTFARYMLSDGFGGAHALLVGFIGDNTGQRYSISGNVWNGTTSIQFGSDEGPAANEWGHLSVGWDGNFIITYFDGVPVGLTPFTGPRMPGGDDNGAGKLFIGGSDHNNFQGRIAQVRGFENSNPREPISTAGFRPDTVFGLFPNNLQSPRATFLTSFLRPSLTVPDIAGGLAGTLRGTGNTAPNPISTYPLPQFIFDPNAPNTFPDRRPTAPAVQVDTPSPAPAKAIIFDSFSRKNSTLAFDGLGGLGFTESGSTGVKEWQEALVPGGSPTHGPFGTLNGRAVTLTNFAGASLAWVDPGPRTGYTKVSVSRTRGFWNTGLDTGLGFRIVDSANFFFAFTGSKTGTPADLAPARTLSVGYYENGVRHFLVNNITMPENWNNFMVVTTSTGDISIFVNDSLLYFTNNALMSNATGIGIFNYGTGLALLNRWDDFTVLDQP